VTSLALLSKSLLRKPSMFEHYSTGLGAAKESFVTHGAGAGDWAGFEECETRGDGLSGYKTCRFLG
jgi:hypothetical protein